MFNEVSGTWMSVGEWRDTATLLGLRSMGMDTPLSVFNDGDGVPIRSGSIDPETGLLTQPVTLISPSVWPTVVRSKLTWRARTVGDVLAALQAAAGPRPPCGLGECTAELTLNNGIVVMTTPEV